MNRGKYMLECPERFADGYRIPMEKVEKSIQTILHKLSAKIPIYTDGFPMFYENDIPNRYKLGENDNWTCGMHTGNYVLAYALTGDEAFRRVAEHHLDSYQKRIDEFGTLNDHDVGFVFSPSCVALYKLTGNEYAKELALRAANLLYEFSYTEKGGFLLRSGIAKDISDKSVEPWCRTMMDSMLNIPLFFWATEETGDKKYAVAGKSQCEITGKYLIRPDSSSNHHYQFELITYKPLHGHTLQGNRDDSTWSRGHSWGILGYPIAYSYGVRDEYVLPLYRDITHYFLNHLPEDLIPYWDFDFIDGDEPRDTSAAAIAATGMLAATEWMPLDEKEKEIYRTAAHKIINSIIDLWTTETGDEYDGFLSGVTPARRLSGFPIHTCAPYGDYFFFEALIRIYKPELQLRW